MGQGRAAHSSLGMGSLTLGGSARSRGCARRVVRRLSLEGLRLADDLGRAIDVLRPLGPDPLDMEAVVCPLPTALAMY